MTLLRRLGAGLGVIVLVGATMAAVGSAPAAGAGKTSYRYSTARTYKSALGCITVRLTGLVSSTKSSYVSAAGHVVYKSKNPRLSSARMTTTVRSCGSGARKRVKRARTTQAWTYNSCKLNPSFSVAAPFSVGVSVTPSCGRRKAAIRGTTYGKASAFEQSNPGQVARWKKSFTSTNPSTKGLCVRGTATVTVYKRNKSITKTFDMGRVCA